MTTEASDISLDEAADHALKRWGLTYEEHMDVLSQDCKYGHMDCARRTGGACFGEAIAESAGIIARERNAETEYTVVGLWIDSDPPCRVAAWVTASSPDKAIEKARRGEGTDGDVGDLLVAGVFEGRLTAVDEQ